MDEVVAQRGVQDAGRVELLAGDSGPDDGKNPRADYSPDAERGKRPWTEGLLEPVLGLFRIPNQLID
jgi:hypothetical protein